MTTHLVIMLMAAIPLAQSGPTQTPAAPAKTLTGCVQAVPSGNNYFTLSDKTTGNTYHLTGRDVKTFVWRNVRIVGGLVPTATIAAQAGAIDPTRAAMANQRGPRPGQVPPLEFNVLRVRATSGSCAPTPK